MTEWVAFAFLAGMLTGIAVTGWLAERFMEAKFREAGLMHRWNGKPAVEAEREERA